MPELSAVDALLAVGLGIGLAAAAGLRIFVPLLALALAARFGGLELAPAFAWLGSVPAIVALGVAAVVEIGAYYVPGLDHLLDVVAGPAAVGAGIVVAAAVMTDLPSWLQWPLAIIAGGGSAGLVQGASTLLRAKSGALTGGLGNPVVASGELGGAVTLSVLALLAPVVAVVLVILLLWAILRVARRLLDRHRA
jgi:hypothetical protein